MAAAEKLSFIDSPRMLHRLVEASVPVVSSVEEPVSLAKRSNVQMLTQAPRLAAAQKPLDFEEALTAYMASVLECAMALAQQQSTITQAQTNTSQGYVTEAQAVTKDEVDALQQELKDQAAELAKSKLQTILGYVGAGILALIGLVTANPELAIMAGLMATDQATGATDKLAQYLSDHLSNLPSSLQTFLTVLTKVAVALMLAIVVGGLVGGIQAAVEETAANGEKSLAEKAFQYGFKNGKGFLGYGQFMATFTQMMVIVNPFTDIMQSVASQIPMSDASRKVFSQIMGIATALILAYVAGRYTGIDGAPSMAEKMAKSMTSTFRTGVQFVLGTLLAANQVATGILSMQQGSLTHDEAKATRMYGCAQGLLILFTSYGTQVSQWIKQLQASASAVNDAFSAMNNRWDSYVAPYQLSAEITG